MQSDLQYSIKCQGDNNKQRHELCFLPFVLFILWHLSVFILILYKKEKDVFSHKFMIFSVNRDSTVID